MLSDRDFYLTKRLGCQKLLSDHDCYFIKRLGCQNAFRGWGARMLSDNDCYVAGVPECFLTMTVTLLRGCVL